MVGEVRLNHDDMFNVLPHIEAQSIDLILTDPPYIISKDSGMNQHHKN